MQRFFLLPLSLYQHGSRTATQYLNREAVDLISKSTQTAVGYPLDGAFYLTTFAYPYQRVPWLYFLNLYHRL